MGLGDCEKYFCAAEYSGSFPFQPSAVKSAILEYVFTLSSVLITFDFPTIIPKLKLVLTALAGPTLTLTSTTSFNGKVDIVSSPIYYVLI